MTRTVALNGLFILAGCTSSLASEALYRIALIAIVLILRMLWAKAMIQRAIHSETQRALDTDEYTLDAILEGMSGAHPNMR
jgi:hypothetical protein